MTALTNIACGDTSLATPNFALSRRFIEALPAITDPDLSQAVEHLSDALNFIHRIQCQKAVAYVHAAALDRLNDHRLAGVGAGLNRTPGPGMVPLFADPTSFRATVADFARVYLTDERKDAALCANPEHHRAVCDLFAAIELEERRAA